MPADVLILSRKALRDRPLWQWLDGTAEHAVLVTTPAAVRDVPDGARAYFRDVLLVDDYQSWWTEWVAQEAVAAHPVELVATSSEDDVLRAARLRGRFGLAGQDLVSALAYRDKLAMKRAADAAGVPVARYAAVDGPHDLLEFVAAYGYPVVVKPRRGAASIGVQRLADAAELAVFLRAGHLPAAPERAGDWLVESYVDAPMFHVDGVSAGGRVLHCWPGRYSTGNAETLWSRATLTSTMVAPEDPTCAVLQDFAATVLAALPAGPLPTSFHLEAWLPANGRPVLCEVACRTGGGPIAPTYRAAFGVHLSRENLRGQSGQSVTLTTQPVAPDRIRGWILFPLGDGRFHPPGPCPVPAAGVDVALEVEWTEGQRSAGPEYAGEAVATATFAATTAAQAAQTERDLLRWWQDSEVWR